MKEAFQTYNNQEKAKYAGKMDIGCRAINEGIGAENSKFLEGQKLNWDKK